MASPSSPSTGAPPASLPSTPTKQTPSNDRGGITPLQMGLAAVILGASAGLTLYTKRTSTLLTQLERSSKNATERFAHEKTFAPYGPRKFGPKTRAEWEKARSRWEKDDL